MYDLPYHKESNDQVVRQFIDQHPFALLTGCDAQGRPVATQVPVFLETRDGRTLLSGHLMKHTDHHRAFMQNENVLVVFTGSHTYVSGSWYSDPHSPSTWNYMSVHVRGSIRLLAGEAVEKVLRKTSLYFENGDSESPTVYDNLSDDFKRMAIKALAAFEIEVEDIRSVFKLSQDRDAESYCNIMAKLKGQSEDARVIAAEMEERFGELFSGSQPSKSSSTI